MQLKIIQRWWSFYLRNAVYFFGSLLYSTTMAIGELKKIKRSFWTYSLSSVIPESMFSSSSTSDPIGLGIFSISSSSLSGESESDSLFSELSDSYRYDSTGSSYGTTTEIWVLCWVFLEKSSQI